MAIEGTADRPQFLDFPSGHTWNYRITPSSRPFLVRALRDTEQNTEGIGDRSVRGSNRRGLPLLLISQRK